MSTIPRFSLGHTVGNIFTFTLQSDTTQTKMAVGGWGQGVKRRSGEAEARMTIAKEMMVALFF